MVRVCAVRHCMTAVFKEKAGVVDKLLSVAQHREGTNTQGLPRPCKWIKTINTAITHLTMTSDAVNSNRQQSWHIVRGYLEADLFSMKLLVHG